LCDIGKRRGGPGPASTFVFPRLKQAVVLYHGGTLVFDSKEAHCLGETRYTAARLQQKLRRL
jgi:hypothetical protein